jgi:beta-phosphoglucomutase-like phosphatase (HAD superfamily)
MDNDTKKAVAASLREVAARLLKPVKASVVMAADTKKVFKDALTGKELDWAQDEQLQRAVEVAKEAAAEVSREIPGIREALEAIRKELTKRVAASASLRASANGKKPRRPVGLSRS